MASIRRTSALTPEEHERLSAQRLACSYLIKAGESALFSLGLNSSDIRKARAPGRDQRAAAILLDILSSWRSTLDILQRLDGERAWPSVNTLEGWLQVDPAAIPPESHPSFVGTV